VCGRVCAVGEQTCSRACRQKWDAQLASKRNYTLILYVAIAILVIAFLASVLR